MDSVCQQLKDEFPGRKTQVKLLCNLFGFAKETFVDCVYVYGPASTGKSSIISTLLNKLDIKNAQVNLVECYSSKVLFETILNQLSGHKINAFKGQPYAKCDNMMDFVFNLKKCASEINLNKPVIVLDKAEELRNMDYNLLPSFLKLKEITGLQISVILISEIIFEKYYSKAVVTAPIKIHFPQYTIDELATILQLDYENVKLLVCNNLGTELKITPEFYTDYLSWFLSYFFRRCLDLSELRHMSKLNFVKYCEEVDKKQCKLDDKSSLYRHIAPILKSSLDVLYLRISSINLEWKHQTGEIKYETTRTNKQFAFSKENLAQSLELPYYAKYLLIAAYLASYNPAKEDKRLFMKSHGKKTKRMKDVRAKQVVSEQLTTQSGPKQFGFERLIAIFYAILKENVDFNSNLLAQISTLVELQLLSTMSDNCDLDGRKYKCCVGFEFMQVVAKTLDFDIQKYLVDLS